MRDSLILLDMGSINGNELRARRLALDLSQSEFADRIGVHVRTVSKWERAVHAVPEMVVVILDLLEDRERGATQARKRG